MSKSGTTEMVFDYYEMVLDQKMVTVQQMVTDQKTVTVVWMADQGTTTEKKMPRMAKSLDWTKLASLATATRNLATEKRQVNITFA